MRKNKTFWTIILLFTQFILFAQDKKEEFEAFKHKYSSKAFDYNDVQPPKEKSNFLSNILNYILSFLAKLPWVFIFYVIVILFILFIGYRIYKNGGLLKQNARKISNEADFNYIEQNLNNIDLNELISKAESNNNYPLAIRYLHYKNLQNLDKYGIIEWNPKKTNQQFINQIKNEKNKLDFKENTRIFNQIWFGEFVINANDYQNIKVMFNQFNQTIIA